MSSRERTVLVVDDEAIVRLVSVAMMESLGLRVLEAESGRDALAVLDGQADVELLFTDCRMPGMTGPELARLAVARFPRLKVVLVSGYVDTVENGPWPLLQKPYNRADLERVIRRELDG